MDKVLAYWRTAFGNGIEADTDLTGPAGGTAAWQDHLARFCDRHGVVVPPSLVEAVVTSAALSRVARAMAPDGVGRYLTSQALERRFLAWLADVSVNIYPLRVAFELGGEIDSVRLGAAWDAVVARHPLLGQRPVVDAAGGVWLRDDEPPRLMVISDELSPRGADEPRRVGQDPSRDRLVEFTLRRHKEAWRLELVASHLLVDAYSINLLLKELSRLYNQPGTVLPDAPSYHDWAQRQREFLSSPAADETAQWWSRQLAGAKPVSPFADLPAGDSAEVRVMLDGQEAASLRRSARRHKVTVFAMFLTALAMTAAGRGVADRLVVSTSFARRDTVDDYGVVGCLTSRTLIALDLRCLAPDNPEHPATVIQQQVWEALRHSQPPYSWIRHAAWPWDPGVVDADRRLPYLAINESWRHQLTLEGVTVTPVVNAAPRSSGTFETWVESMPSGYHIALCGPTSTDAIAELHGELMVALGYLQRSGS